MRIIRKAEQRIDTRGAENREVCLIFSGAIPPSDGLVVTHSTRQMDRDALNVAFHSHPNAIEFILFQKASSLEICACPQKLIQVL